MGPPNLSNVTHNTCADHPRRPERDDATIRTPSEDDEETEQQNGPIQRQGVSPFNGCRAGKLRNDPIEGMGSRSDGPVKSCIVPNRSAQTTTPRQSA